MTRRSSSARVLLVMCAHTTYHEINAPLYRSIYLDFLASVLVRQALDGPKGGT